MGKVQCSLCFLVVALVASVAWVCSLAALFAPGDVVVGPSVPPDMGNEKGVVVERTSLPGVSDSSGDYGWYVAQYQGIASRVDGGSNNEVKQTIHSEFGLAGVRSTLTNKEEPMTTFNGGPVDFVNTTTWEKICESLEPWLDQSGGDLAPSDVLAPCGSVRTTAYKLWAFSVMCAAFAAGLSWFVCCCPYKAFRRFGGLLALLSVALGSAGLAVWLGALGDMESRLGCEAFLRVGAAAAYQMQSKTFCTNWHDILSTAPSTIKTTDRGNAVCAFDNNGLRNSTEGSTDRRELPAESRFNRTAGETYLYTNIDPVKNNVMECGRATATMLAALALALLSSTALLFCLVSGEASDGLESDSDDDDETRATKRIARIKKAAGEERRGHQRAISRGDETFEAVAEAPLSRDDGDQAGAPARRAPRKKGGGQAQPPGYADPLSAQFGGGGWSRAAGPAALQHQGSVRNPVAGETEMTSI